jgi:hypothetical protein
VGRNFVPARVWLQASCETLPHITDLDDAVVLCDSEYAERPFSKCTICGQLRETVVSSFGENTGTSSGLLHSLTVHSPTLAGTSAGSKCAFGAKFPRARTQEEEKVRSAEILVVGILDVAGVSGIYVRLPLVRSLWHYHFTSLLQLYQTLRRDASLYKARFVFFQPLQRT